MTLEAETAEPGVGMANDVGDGFPGSERQHCLLRRAEFHDPGFAVRRDSGGLERTASPRKLLLNRTGPVAANRLPHVRQRRACRLLDMTDMSVKAIASVLGYEDPLYFSRLFRKVNEKSPLEYRRTHKG